MKQGRRPQKFILHHWWTYVIWKMLSWRRSTRSTKVELYSEVILSKTIQGLMQYSPNKDLQHLKWQPPSSWISSPDCQIAMDKQRTQYLLIPKWKWKMLTDDWKFPNRNVQTFGVVYSDTNGLSHGPVSMTQSFLLNGICTVILWQDCYGKGNLRKSYCSTVGRKFPIGNVFSYTVKWIILICVCGWHKMSGKKQNIDPMWKVLNKEVDLGEPTSFLDHENLGCTQRQCEISKDIVDNYRTMFWIANFSGWNRKNFHTLKIFVFLHGLMIWRVMQRNVWNDIVS